MPNTVAHLLPTSPTIPQGAHSLLLPVSILSLMFNGVRNPFDHFRSAVLVMLPPTFLYPCSLAVHGQWRTPWLILSATEEQQKKHWCAINIVLLLNPKHSTVLPSRRKFNSIQAKSRPALNDMCVYEKTFPWQSTFFCLSSIKKHHQCNFWSQWHVQSSNTPSRLIALY